MKIRMPKLRRTSYAMMAVLLAATVVVPTFVSSKASAYGQVTSRSIEMSSSLAGEDSVSYNITFTTGTTSAIQGVVVDFCEESPIIGDENCSLPDGMVVGTTLGTITGLNTVSGWAAAQDNSGRTLSITKSDGGSVNSGTVVNIPVSGFTNPTAANTTFYARILTYATQTAAQGYGNATPDIIGTPVDAGGVALSTANGVNVSGTVAETLTFCVSSWDFQDGDDCTDGTDAPELVLGHGTPKTLDANQTDTATAYSLLYTNAGGGVTVRMRNSNTCGGLSKDGGTTCEIEPAGDTPTAFNSGDALFGMRVASAFLTDGTGTLNSQAPYNDGSNYGMDNETPNENVTSAYGDEVAKSSGVLDKMKSTYTFAARASNTTPAGVYTATMTLIATGTY